MTAKRHLLILAALVGGVLSMNALPQVQMSVNYQYANLAYPGALLTLPNAINNGGSVVGSYFDASSNQHGFLFRDGKFYSIDVPGSTATEAMGINDFGDIVGDYQLPGPLNFHGFIRHRGEFSKLDEPNAAFGTKALAINNSGVIVGSYDDAHGYIYRNGAFRTYDAPQLPGETPNTQLNGISNLGWVAGQVFTGGIWRGFWIAGGDFGFLESARGIDSEVTAINSHGDIVGCHDSNSGFISFGLERKEPKEGVAEPFPRQHRLASCTTGINYARAVVGIYFTVSKPYGFLAVPSIILTASQPLDHSVQPNPVKLVATASGTHDITQIQVWVNYKQVFHVKGNSLNTKLTLPTGPNQRLVIQAVDSQHRTAKVVASVTVH